MLGGQQSITRGKCIFDEHLSGTSAPMKHRLVTSSLVWVGVLMLTAAKLQAETSFTFSGNPTSDGATSAKAVFSTFTGLVIGANAFFFSHRDQLVRLATRYSVPTVYPWREAVVAGGLMS